MDDDDMIVKIILFIILLILSLGFTQIVYNDWTCTFKNCVVIKEDV